VSLAESRPLRIATLCVLYVAQGIPWGFMASTLPGYLTDRKLDFGFVATTLSFTTLPYSFKWVWGPIIDTFSLSRFGRRRPWIIFAQAMMALTVFAMVSLDVTAEVKLLAWMVFIHTVFNALQDVAVDALAVDILPDNERGSANGLMYASKYAGGALGGVGMAKLIAASGLDTALTVQSLVLVAIMFVPLLVRERAEPAESEPPRAILRANRVKEIASGLAQVFSLRSPLVMVVLLLVVQLASGMLSATGYKLFIEELKWKYDDYAELTGGWGLLAGCVFAASTGLITDRLGRRKVAAFACMGLATSWALFAAARDWGWWQDHTYVYVSSMLETALQATLSVSLIALSMDLSWPKIAATQFTAYMALLNFSTTLGYQFAAKANAWWSFSTIYIVAAIVQVAAAGLLVLIDPTESRRKLPLPEGARQNRAGLYALVALLLFLIGMTAYVTLQKVG
jgi:PAT family beta-lactamase induction signal transducer AmpG